MSATPIAASTLPGGEDADKPEPAASKAPEVAPADELELQLNGGAYLWYYLPFRESAKHDLSLYFAHLILDASYGMFGVHFEPRFRDIKLRQFYPTNVWVQNAYGFIKSEPITFKVGKVYTQFGKFWDNSFYGNIPYFDGLKLNTDYGVSLEGAFFSEEPFRLQAYAQYFINDGITNGSLDGRDTVSIPDARRRNEVVLRVAPAYFFDQNTSLTLGVSGEYLQADLPEPTGLQNVTRGAVDVTFSLRDMWSVFAEYARQMGRHVTDYPIAGTAATATAPAVPGVSSARNAYVWAGTELRLGNFTGRFNFSFVDYEDVDIQETMFQPGVNYKLHNHFIITAEYVNWHSFRRGSSYIDHSGNVVLYAFF